MKRLGSLLLLLIVAFTAYAAPRTRRKAKSPEKKQFAYVLRLAPRYLEEKNWMPQDSQAVQSHFARLQKMLKDGKLVFAGRTTVKEPMGIVVFDATSEAEARRIMEEDDAVKAGVMTAELFPFTVALIRTTIPRKGRK